MDSEITGKKLLKNGGLKRRCTILPLNKITGRPIDDATFKRAEALVSKKKLHIHISYNTLLPYHGCNFPGCTGILARLSTPNFCIEDLQILRNQTYEKIFSGCYCIVFTFVLILESLDIFAVIKSFWQLYICT